MEQFEGWDLHPTRKNIFINQKDGLLYERSASGWFNRIPQKMTKHQELECFRKADGVVRMIFRSKRELAPPADLTPGECHI